MKRLPIFATLLAFASIAHAKEISVARFHAPSDGKTLATTAIQSAIDEAAKGGDTVTFPAGTYLSGSIFVKSGVTLRIDKGVTIIGSERLADYPLLPTRVAGIEMTWPAALINVYKQTKATITGEGTIDGNGKIWWDSYWALRKIDDAKGLRWAADYDSQRPRLIQIFESSSVKLGGGLQLRRAGFWTVHICYSHEVTVDGVTIRNNEGGRGPSTDGVDIDSSHDIVVAHADIANNDDALCLKAGRDADGLRVNRPTYNVVIRDSVIREAAAGVTFGSETSGGFRNIEVYNLHTLEHVPSGILFKSARTRGGFAEDIRIHDLTLEGTPVVLRMTMNWNPNYSYARIPEGLTDYPAYYKTLTAPVTDEQGLEHVHDVHIWNITARGAKMIFDVMGNPRAPLRNFQLDHFDVAAASAGHISHAENWTAKDMHFFVADGTAVSITDSANVTGFPSGKPSDATQQAPHKYED